MIYSDLLKLMQANKITVKDISEALDMTPTGFKRSIDCQTLPIKKVVPLCNTLCISVSQFFGVQNTPVEQYYNSQVQRSSGDKAKNIQLGDTKATEALVQQIAEKDKQISKLLDLLSKN